MAQPRKAAPVDPIQERQERIESAMSELRPKVDAILRQMVETIVDKPEAEEFGAVEYELRDIGQGMMAQIQQTGLNSRKKRAT
jgi:hypothetical protein